MPPIEFTANGEPVSIEPTGRTALDLIRSDLGLTGTKQTCGHGGCGSCAVLVNGRPVETCTLEPAALAGTEVETVEGVAPQGDLHPVQRALVDCDAIQCGFCTPGMVVAGTAFFRGWRQEHGTERPPASEVARALDGHLCRCGAYPDIVAAVQAACAGDDTAMPVGGRPDAPAKARGEAIFTVDVTLPGMLHGRILRSTEPHAEITAIDTSAVTRLTGVRAVVDLLPKDRIVRYVGQPIAAVAAVDEETADRALTTIAVRYRVLPAAVGMAAAMGDDAPDLIGRKLLLTSSNEAGAFAAPIPRSGNRRGPWTPFSKRRYTARRRIEAARRRNDPLLVEGTWRTAGQSHASPEPHTAVADWGPAGLTVYLSTQSVTAAAAKLAKRYGLDRSRVRVVAEHVGGAFGSKQGLTEPVVEAVELSRAAGAPVRVSLSTQEELSVTGYRPSSEIHLAILGRADGCLEAVEATAHMDGGDSVGQTVVNLVRLSYPGPPMSLVDYDVVNNAPPAKAFQAPGSPKALFALETAIDELAGRMGEDPISLRMQWDPRPLRRRVYEWAAAHPLWQGRRDGGGSNGILRGVGVAFGTWYYGYDPQTSVRVLSDPTGFTIESGLQDIGTGSRTTLARAVGEVFGVDPDLVSVRLGNSALGHGPTSSASRTTPSLHPTAVRAARDLHGMLIQSVVHDLGLAGASPVPGGVDHAGEYVPWSDLLPKLVPQVAVAKRPGDARPPVSPIAVEGVQIGWGLSDAAHLVEVEVDRSSGSIRATRAAVALAAGRIVAPRQATSQVHGALARGIGLALYEGRRTDLVSGRVTTVDYESYRLMRASEMPEVEAVFFEEGFDHAPGGVAGIAELAITSVPAAVANAVAAATGRYPRDLPISPAMVGTTP